MDATPHTGSPQDATVGTGDSIPETAVSCRVGRVGSFCRALGPTEALEIRHSCDGHHIGRGRVSAYSSHRRARVSGRALKKEVAMLDVLAFSVVAVALATPFLVPLLWGQLEKA